MPGKGGTTGVAGASHGGTTGAAGAPEGQGGSPGQGGGGPAGAPGKGGVTGTGLAGRGGTTGAAGSVGAKGGATGTAGTTGAAGTPGTGGAVEVNCDAPALTGGTTHTSSNASGTAAGLAWTIWSNGSAGSITTYDIPAFSADWNNSGDFLARLGLQWNASKTYDQLGTVTSQFAYKKTGSGGGYSYIGIYGWSVSPCVEFYIVDDSFNKMPVNPGSTTNKGTVTIDGGDYILYTRPTNGTGGSKCGNVSSWTQFYSVRKTARTCGTISISEHFKAWAAAGMTLGKMDQAQILVEVGGGSGSVDFTTANVTATP
jgi:endo-1,4-beta-xylanase